MSSWRHRLTNAVPIMLLSTPLHPLMGRHYALLSVTGRRSGTVYKIPIAVVDLGDRIGFTTDSRWVRNLRALPDSTPATVGVRLRGRDHTGRADIVTDEDRGVDILRALTIAIPSYARPAGLTKSNGQVPETELRNAIQNLRVAVEITKEN